MADLTLGDAVHRSHKLREFIKQPESRGDYNIVWGGIKAKDRPPRPLTQMTIGQVLAWQDSIDRFYRSEAAGAYQIMEDTLRGLYASAGMSPGDLFDEVGQDRLATALLIRRGYLDYLNGKLTDEAFANNLAKEWASLPVVTGPKKGRSYYGGDGLNKAHVGVDEFMAAVRASKQKPATKPGTVPTQPTGGGFFAALAALVKAIFGNRKGNR